MIKGMTGFGSAQFSTGKVKAIVEIKSLNHRYFDLNFFLPIGFASVENRIRQMVQKSVQRGRVTISMKITSKPQVKIILNEDIVKAHMRFASRIKKDFGLKNNLTMSDIVRMPGVLDTQEDLVRADDVWLSLEKCITNSLRSLIAMKKREGKSLRVDISDKLRRMTAQVKKIQARSKVILREKKKALPAEEFGVFKRSNDVNEEISRLAHYVDEVKKLLKSESSVGKKIDFVAQEMQRETNTIGSKMQDKVVSNAVIALKSKIEKIREQAQNVE